MRIRVRFDFGHVLRLSAMAQAPLFGIALLFLCAQTVLFLLYPRMDIPGGTDVLVTVLSTLLVLAIVLFAYLFGRMAMTDRPEHPAIRLIGSYWAFLCDGRAMALGLPAIVSLLIFIYAFSTVKGNIPVFHPFSWDPIFARWDSALHFGRDPWRWLQPVLGHWPVSFLINVLYNLWFAVMAGFWLHYGFFVPPGVRRTRFFLAFMLMWMLGGGLLAVVFSSAGPCFYGAGYLGLSPDPYAPLMSYLRDANRLAPIWALHVQDMQWNFHEAGSVEASISAMPSMHNGSALLFALASGGWPRWVRRSLWAFVAIIFVGSIHLGYHYALDGYVAWAAAVACWAVAGPLARRWEETPAATRFRQAYAESPASL